MQRSMGRSRDMPADRSGLSGIPDAIGDAEALGIEPAHFPESLLRTPDGAEALGALAQIGLGVGDAHDDHFLIPAARGADTRLPGHGVDDQFDCLVAPAGAGVVEVAHAEEAVAVALGVLLRPGLPGPPCEARFHFLVTVRARRGLTLGG